MNHFFKTINSISYNQWFGLLLGEIIAVAAWTKLVFIISPLKGNKPKIGKYQIYALLIGMFISLLAWMKIVAIVDPISMTSSGKNCNCEKNIV
tara:strand:+ start:3889 stop:4167 length:279 start_codon:yes stop_codon:yes gene_type:complete